MESRAESTTQTYASAFDVWSRWAAANKVSPLPAQPLTIALYLLGKIQQGHSYAVCKAAFYGIKYWHTLHLMSDPTDSLLPIRMLEAAKRLDTRNLRKKEPITSAILAQLYKKLVDGEGTLSSIRTMCFCVLGY